MAKDKNETSTFKYDFKNREIKQVDVIKRNDQLAIYKITFGEEMTKEDKIAKLFSRLEEKLDKRFDAIDKRFEAIDKRFDKLETKIDNLTDAVVELQSEAKNHG